MASNRLRPKQLVWKIHTRTLLHARCMVYEGSVPATQAITEATAPIITIAVVGWFSTLSPSLLGLRLRSLSHGRAPTYFSRLPVKTPKATIICLNHIHTYPNFNPAETITQIGGSYMRSPEFSVAWDSSRHTCSKGTDIAYLVRLAAEHASSNAER